MSALAIPADYLDPETSRPHYLFGDPLDLRRPAASGEDLLLVVRREIEARRHFESPQSQSVLSTASRFRQLSQDWQSEAEVTSSPSKIAMSPAYQQIIGMGRAALPFILQDLQVRGGHWFWALRSIAGMDPVPSEERGDYEAMRARWLDWGFARGFIASR